MFNHFCKLQNLLDNVSGLIKNYRFWTFLIGLLVIFILPEAGVCFRIDLLDTSLEKLLSYNREDSSVSIK